MNYEEFVASLLEEVQNQLEEGMQVKVQSVLKNNGMELTGFTIFRKEESVAPNIYINGFYGKYQDGIAISVLAEEIISCYYEKKDSFLKLEEFQFEWEERKGDIFYRVVSYTKNKELLKNIPHLHFLDLAVIFYCLMYSREGGMGSIRITNEHKNKWRIHTKDLMRMAEQNTPRIFPAKIRNLNQLLSELIGLEKEKLQPDPFEKAVQDDRMPSLYVISNECNINGASAILYPRLLQDFANQLEMNLYILPSSIHEIIVLPAEDRFDDEVLKETVQYINRLMVIPEEVLSDHAYYYSRESHTLEA